MEQAMKWQRGLVTGASAGIGAEYLRQLAPHCDTLTAVARRADRLVALAGELAPRCRVEVLEADLGSLEGQARVVEHLRQKGPFDLLVNNAGFSTFGAFSSADLDQELAMVRLHQDATLTLTRAALPYMLEMGRGALINVASVGAFLPLPAAATYAATKAFLLSFSRSLQLEVGRRGVRVQCLCPGYTRTEIHSRETFRGFDASRVPEELWMESEAVVAESLEALARDQLVVVPGAPNRVQVRQSLQQLLDAVAD
jgi:short-subunit dehydrogenase